MAATIKKFIQRTVLCEYMPIKRPQIINGEIYHLTFRAAGDVLLFKSESDYFSAIFSLYEFNTTGPIEIRKQREKRKALKASGEQISAGW